MRQVAVGWIRGQNSCQNYSREPGNPLALGQASHPMVLRCRRRCTISCCSRRLENGQPRPTKLDNRDPFGVEPHQRTDAKQVQVDSLNQVLNHPICMISVFKNPLFMEQMLKLLHEDHSSQSKLIWIYIKNLLGLINAPLDQLWKSLKLDPVL